MTRFTVAANKYKEEAAEIIKNIKSFLSPYDCSVKIPKDDGDLFENTDFLIILGGDGTVLNYAKRAAEHKIPVVGINLGRIGYLSSLEKNEISDLVKLIDGRYKIISRSMLCLEYKGNEYTALNDVIMAESRSSRMITAELSADGGKIVDFACSSIVFCTPTGSTGFNLSAGGPVIDPSLDTITVTPVCPHTTPSQSMVFSGKTVLSLKNTSTPDKTVLLTIDGATDIEFYRGSEVIIRNSGLTADFAVFDDKPFAQKFFERIRF